MTMVGVYNNEGEPLGVEFVYEPDLNDYADAYDDYDQYDRDFYDDDDNEAVYDG